MQRLSCVVVHLIITSCVNAVLSTRLDDVASYEVIIPKNQYGTTYSKIDMDEVAFDFSAFNKYFYLRLFKNKLSIPRGGGYETMQQIPNGNMSRTKDCFYQGFINNRSNFSAVINTCNNGLNGFIRGTDDQEYVIRPYHADNDNDNENIVHGNQIKHKIYRINHVLNGTTSSALYDAYIHQGNIGANIKKRVRDFLPNNFRRTRRNIKSMKYISVVVVMDKASCKIHGNRTENRALDIINNVDMLYQTLRTRIALRTLIIWNKEDKIKISSDAGETLTNFETYTQHVFFGSKKINADLAILITGVSFKDATGARAGDGTMCTSRAAAIISDNNEISTLVSNRVAHSIGHTLGLQHVLKCRRPPCVMDEQEIWIPAKGFADYTRDEFYKLLHSGRLTCLLDYPMQVHGRPICGNGLLERGEDCDCGAEEECKRTGADKCCIPKTCKLQILAKCAEGICCANCQLQPRGILCRKPYDEVCDLPEYCTGETSHCPVNKHASDGQSCLSGTGSCFGGFCVNLAKQCQTLWGPNAVKAIDLCYELNTKKNDRFANCGQTSDSEFVACKEKDKFCGKLQCTSKDEYHPLPHFPIITGIRRGRMSKQVWLGGFKCHLGYVPFYRGVRDPAMVLSGTRCGEGKICVEHECRDISSLTG